MAYLAQSSYKVPLLHRDPAHNRLSFRRPPDPLRSVLPTTQRPTLSLSKGGLDRIPVGTPPSVAVGSILTYTLTLSNTSAVDALNVTLNDTLPSGFMFGGWLNQDTATLSANLISWRGLLSSQQPLPLIYTGTVLRTAQTLTNLVQARADETALVEDTLFYGSTLPPDRRSSCPLF